MKWQSMLATDVLLSLGFTHHFGVYTNVERYEAVFSSSNLQEGVLLWKNV